jgi:two-component system, OmpR family, phosphate regulon response regulator OmpR
MKSTLPHILVIDDDNRLRALLRKFLTENGFLVVGSESAQTAREHLSYLQFDLLVLDGMMPKETGFDFLKKLRQTSDIPVLMLTAMGESADRISGLEHGADDYLTKPFEPKELVLRINSILKRTTKPPEGKMADYIDGSLTTAEENLLTLLMAQVNKPISRTEIANKSNIDERAVDVQIARLRKKLKNSNSIQTVRGEGYKLIS